VTEPEHGYVSRGGLKLAAALDQFGVDPGGWTCADLGCNVGGFTDCLLRRGAAKVYAVDSGYGALAWKLRQDARVVVMERTNALHAPIPTGAAVDLAVIDLGWTRQAKAIAAALRWSPRRIITLVKPHYEDDRVSPGGVLSPERSEQVARRVRERWAESGVREYGWMRSPIRGGAGKKKQGNVEFLALLEPA
jgi:23S rRNA (cytidine1920-2'-O)/16S rRNA (cytidine1409-2'-O)-methyltransferase